MLVIKSGWPEENVPIPLSCQPPRRRRSICSGFRQNARPRPTGSSQTPLITTTVRDILGIDASFGAEIRGVLDTRDGLSGCGLRGVIDEFGCGEGGQKV